MEREKPIRLTQTVKKGGCAAKLPAGELRAFLQGLTLKAPPELLVGATTFDDAGVWDLGDGRCLIQTVDFFTPIVDDPYDFGAIAAANALSDVYAMGGRPATAMSVLAFPAAHLPPELLKPLFAGALDRIHAAGACLIGGHSIDDETLKLGFSVSGFALREKIWTNSGARAGDVLILTKPLGTGTITSALKKEIVQDEHLQAAITSMKQLNSVALDDFTVHAATDITGFGLAGHLAQMARASKVQMVIESGNIPTLPGARHYIAEGVLNRAHHTNRSYIENAAAFAPTLAEAEKWLVCDPQTSGGLLLVVPPQQADAVLAHVKELCSAAARIGHVLPLTSTEQSLLSFV